MKKVSLVLIITLLFSSFGAISYAAETDFDITIKRTQMGDRIIQIVEISGTAEKEDIFKPVAISVIKKDVEPPYETKDIVKAINQTYVKINKTYFRDFYFNEEGEFDVFVKVGDKDKVSKTVKTYSVDILVEFLKAIKNGTMTSNEFVDTVCNDYEALGIDGTCFKELSEKSREEAANDVISDMKLFTVDELSEILDLHTFIKALSLKNEFEAREKIIKKYRQYADSELAGLIDMYQTNNEDERKKILEEVESKVPDDLSYVSKAFKNAVFNASFRAINNYVEIIDIVSEYSDMLGCDSCVEEFNDMKDARKNIICQYILQEKSKVNSVDSFTELLKYGVNNIEHLEEENTKEVIKNGNGTGGGGGGSAPRVETVKPATEPDKDNNSGNETVIRTEFTDLSGFSWASTSIKELYDKNIISGKAEGIFAPNDNVTRAEFCKMAALAFGYNKESEMDFADVPESHWAYRYINNLKTDGITEGTGIKTFSPDECISRQDIITILYRIMVTKAHKFDFSSYEITYADKDEISNYAKAAIGMLKESGIIVGFSDNTIRPLNMVTRAETAVLIVRVINAMN